MKLISSESSGLRNDFPAKSPDVSGRRSAAARRDFVAPCGRVSVLVDSQMTIHPDSAMAGRLRYAWSGARSIRFTSGCRAWSSAAELHSRGVDIN